MLEKIKKHKLLITIVALLVASNLFTIAVFYNQQIDPEVKVQTPGQNPIETNIMNDSPGSSWNGDVTNTQPVIKSEQVTVKNPVKVPVYATRTLYESASFNADGTPTPNTRAWREVKAPAPPGGYVVVYDTKQESYITGYEYK